MGTTMFDRIWDQHVVDDLGNGVFLLHVDRHLMHDLSGQRGQLELKKRGLRMRNPGLTLGSMDHVVSTVPAVICGVLLILILTGTTLNVQSFMGAIMAIGISVANAILLATFAENARRGGAVVTEATLEGSAGRLRAVLMTAMAMITGMIPIALGTGEGAQAAPLGRAVIGGLVLATFATLTVLPAFYAILQARARPGSPSLNPSDPESKYYEPI